MTRLRQRTLEELESRKSLRWCLAGLRIREFDPIAEATEVADHLPSAKLLRSFGNRWAPFFITDSAVQEHQTSRHNRWVMTPMA